MVASSNGSIIEINHRQILRFKKKYKVDGERSVMAQYKLFVYCHNHVIAGEPPFQTTPHVDLTTHHNYPTNLFPTIFNNICYHFP